MSRSRWKCFAACARIRRAPDAVIVVVDASNLQRNLYLVSQLIEMGKPLVVALNMMDVAERRGLNISPERLQKTTGRSGDSGRRAQTPGDRSAESGDRAAAGRADAGLASSDGNERGS